MKPEASDWQAQSTRTITKLAEGEWTKMNINSCRTALGCLVLVSIALSGCNRRIVIATPRTPPPVVIASTGEYLSIPPGHLPPPGECRIWIPGRPPGQQPPPQPCGAGLRIPLGGWLLSRDGNAEHIRVSVYDSALAGIVTAIRVYIAATGKFVREERR